MPPIYHQHLIPSSVDGTRLAAIALTALRRVKALFGIGDGRIVGAVRVLVVLIVNVRVVVLHQRVLLMSCWLAWSIEAPAWRWIPYELAFRAGFFWIPTEGARTTTKVGGAAPVGDVRHDPRLVDPLRRAADELM
ncbi:MAG TPA: hypothetical protein VGQ44_01575 [Gemmatimonadaceae bacterium]|jgi:hypothetical protein|nr:hypothetical protein [Gemmatimonadaceae bacterium]